MLCLSRLQTFSSNTVCSIFRLQRTMIRLRSGLVVAIEAEAVVVAATITIDRTTEATGEVAARAVIAQRQAQTTTLVLYADKLAIMPGTVHKQAKWPSG